jgi:hypothetical protein
LSQEQSRHPGVWKRRSDVIRAGRPCAQIIAELSDPVLGPTARMLQDLIGARTGVTIPIVEPETAMGERNWPGGMTHIVVGVLGTNQVVQTLYYQYLTFVDHAFPGPEGFVLQTVVDPYGKGSDFVILAGIGARPLAKAIAKLADLLAWDNDEIYLSHLNVVDVVDQGLKQAGVLYPRKEPGIPKDPGTHFLWLRDEADRLAKEAGPESGGLLLAHACCAGMYYLLSGKPGFLDCLLVAIKAHARLGGPGGGTHKHLYHAMAIWGLLGVPEAGLWARGKEELITGRLLELMRSDEGPRGGLAAGAAYPSGVLGERAAFDALSGFFGGRYFSLRHNLPEAAQWLSLAHRAFGMQESAAKPLCDSALHEGRVMWATATYALASGEMGFFLNNSCRQFCRAMMTARANRGDVPGYGVSAPGVKMPVGLMAIGAHVYQRPGYLGAIHGLPRPLGRGFATKMKPADPGENYVGINKSPVDRQFFYQAVSPEPKSLGQVETDATTGDEGWRPDFQKAFDKLAYRAGPGIDDEFLLIDGVGTGEDAHEDANTVLELSVFGRQFIVEESAADPVFGNRGGSGAQDHNGVTVARDGKDFGSGPGAELELLGDLPGVGFGVTKMHGILGCDWSRQVLWRKGHAFLFFDQMTAREEGRYRYQNTWRALGEARSQQDGTLRLAQGPAGVRQTGKRAVAGGTSVPGVTEFFIVPGEGGRVKIQREPEATAAAFAGYPHAPAVITRMTRTIKGKRQVGDHDEFVTGLFWRKGAGEPSPKVRRVAQTAAFLMDKGFRALGWMQPQDRESQRLLGLQITARAGWIEDDRLSLFGARLFWCRFLSFSASNPVNIEWSRAEGLTVETEAQTELRFRMGPDRYTLAVDAGRHSLGRVVIELPDLYPVMDLVEHAAQGMGQVVRRVDRPESRDQPIRAIRKTPANTQAVMGTVAPASALAVTQEGGATLLAAGDLAGTVFAVGADGREIFRHKAIGPVTGLHWAKGGHGTPGFVLQVTSGAGSTWLDMTGKPVPEIAWGTNDAQEKKPGPDKECPGLAGQQVLQVLSVPNPGGSGVVWVVTTRTDLVIGLDYLGKMVWRLGAGATLTGIVGPDSLGRVYAATETGRVLAVDAQTGAVAFRLRLPGLVSMVCPGGEAAAYAIAGDGVFKIQESEE